MTGQLRRDVVVDAVTSCHCGAWHVNISVCHGDSPPAGDSSLRSRRQGARSRPGHAGSSCSPLTDCRVVNVYTNGRKACSLTTLPPPSLHLLPPLAPRVLFMLIHQSSLWRGEKREGILMVLCGKKTRRLFAHQFELKNRREVGFTPPPMSQCQGKYSPKKTLNLEFPINKSR